MSEMILSSKLLELVNDPIKISIWQEIRDNKGITAKELKKQLILDGTSIYYHLNYLESHNLIISKTHAIPNSNLSKKTYEINKNLFTQDERMKRVNIADSSDKIKEILLFKTHLVISHFQQQARMLSKSSSEELLKLVDEGHIFINDIITVQDKDLVEIQRKINDLKEELDERRGKVSLDEYSKNISHKIIFSVLSTIED